MGQSYRGSERGNVFFTLFGAVAVVGVLGAATVSMMRGPMSTMVEVNRRTAADTQMAIATKLVLLEAISGVDSGDCDADGFVELPASHAATPAPTGGGQLPLSVGATRTDPWGTPYGYCVWDTGPVSGDAACGGGRLAGSGDSARNYTVVAVISAGPDGEFDPATVCRTFAVADVNTNGVLDGDETLIARGGDDIVFEYTYDDARGSVGGLWELKVGDPDVAQIDKDIEVTGTGTFGGGISLGGGTGDFPVVKTDNVQPFAEIPDVTDTITFTHGLKLANTGIEGAACDIAGGNGPGIGAIAVEGTSKLLMCLLDGADQEWVAIGGTAGAGGKWLNAATPGRIYYDVGNVGIGAIDPAYALDVSGSARVSGDYRLLDTNRLGWGDFSTAIRGSGPGSLEFLTGGIAGLTIDSDRRIGAGTAPVAGTRLLLDGLGDDDLTLALHVRKNNGETILHVRDDGRVGIGKEASAAGTLDVSGDINLGRYLKIDAEIVLATDQTESAGTLVLDSRATLDLSTIGENNTLIGVGTAPVLAAGVDNTILGQGAGGALTTGGDNILIGQGVAPTLETGSRNILIGVHKATPLPESFVDVPALDTEDYLNIGNTLYGRMDTKRIGIGVAAPTVSLDVLGSGNFTGTVNAGNYQLAGNSFVPSGSCSGSNKITWSGTTWGCSADLQGGSSGSGSNFEDVLAQGNNAGNRDARGLKDLGAVRYCNADLSTCFLAADIGPQNLAGVLVTGPNAGNAADAVIRDVGSMAIGSAVLSGTLLLDVSGGVGAQTYCDADGSKCFTADDIEDIQDGAIAVPGADGDILFKFDDRMAVDTGLFAYDAVTKVLSITGMGRFVRDGDNLVVDTAGAAQSAGLTFRDQTIDQWKLFKHTDNDLRLDRQGLGTVMAFERTQGYVGVGTQTPAERLHVLGHARLEAYNDMPADSAALRFYRGRGTSGASTILQDGDVLGSVTFGGFDGVDVERTAAIQSWVVGAVAENVVPADILFLTSPDTEANRTARMRINSAGNVGIGGTTLPATGGAGGPLMLDVEGHVGAVQYCDSNGDNCFSASGIVQGGAGLWERFDAGAGKFSVRPRGGTVTNYAVDDFVFGSSTLDSTGGQAGRFFYDKALGAFYAGSASTDQWDTRGAGSIALGTDLRAEGANSIALGHMAEVSTTGDHAMAIGLGTTAGTPPVVSAANALGIFLGDQDGVTISQPGTVAVMGGNVGVNVAAPAARLDVGGGVRIGNDPAACIAGKDGTLIYQAGAWLYCDGPGTTWRPLASGSGAASTFIALSDTPGAIPAARFLAGDADGDDLVFVHLYHVADKFGLGAAASDPKTALDVAGTLRIANGGETCTGNVDAVGALRYDSVSQLYQVCPDSTGDWEDLFTGNVETTFAALTDTPDVYTGTARQVVRVNADGDGLAFGGTDALLIPVGDTAGRPAGAVGMIRYNTELGDYEAWDGLAWAPLVTGQGGLWTDLTGGRIHYGTTNANQVGVGTNDPQVSLDVVGTIRADVVSLRHVLDAAAPVNHIPDVLNDLSDVSAPAPSADDVLMWNGTAWTAQALGAGTDAFAVPSGTTAQRPDPAANGMIRYNTTLAGFEVFENGAWVAMGSAVSDIRLKTDIVPLDPSDVIGKLMRVDTYSFRLKADQTGRENMGVIAQELEKIFPDLVDGDGDAVKSVRYVELIAPLIETAQYLKGENDTLRADVAVLKEQVALLGKTAGGGGVPVNGWVMLLLGCIFGGNLAFFLAFGLSRRKRWTGQ